MIGLKYVDVYHYYWIGFEGSLMRVPLLRSGGFNVSYVG